MNSDPFLHLLNNTNLDAWNNDKAGPSRTAGITGGEQALFFWA